MKDTQNNNITSLKQPFSSWTETPTDIFKQQADGDAQPVSKAPAPSVFHTPDILSRFKPDPLLAITPEKSLGRTQAEDTGKDHGCGEGERKGRQRVRFAPGTRTSPPSKMSVTEPGNKENVTTCEGIGGTDNVSKAAAAEEEEEWMPRSFSAISQKLYRPGRYTDGDDGRDSKLSGSKSPVSSAPQRSTAGTQGSKTAHTSVDHCVKSITSEYSSSHHHKKPITAKIVRHKPAKAYDACDEEVSSMELMKAFECSAGLDTLPKTPPRVHSTSPSHRRNSPHLPRKTSPTRCRPVPSGSPCSRSPSRSPSRLTPVKGLEFFTPEEKSEPVVRVIREAPYQPKRSDYVFPFDDGQEEKQDYDSSVENPLARPEFNSALKISEELKSVKGKRLDTWGAVSQKLKTCDRKRTEIQEKASSRVNIGMQSGLFSDLVDVKVPLDDLCQTMEKGIQLRAPSPKPSSVKAPIGKEPDLMEFFSPELQQELPDLTVTGIQPITESLTTANPILAFDLYRHNRAWNGLTDS
ncbi:uncharacterized protein LOC143302092 [Babylonia areolata]|uniref:uncharacterized protein LOC143302092 n=1 Tax=Babylonia areolata TaxID=304850 RepID=UPI003FD6B4F3